MCYFLYLASPLSLSEVRSMLPRGVVADLTGPADQRALKALLPDAQTAARLLIGRCSCDFVRPRKADAREDESHLRERYRRLEIPRSQVIPALEHHRRATGVRAPAGGWPQALASFVAEHARNAGQTLYHLQFSATGDSLGLVGDVKTVTVDQVLARPENWLVEGSSLLVNR
jgi:hypothetical protein